jgi:uncharacterized protein YbjT (DUF2867 family)
MMVLVAGATGALGRAVVQELKSRGQDVRAVGRNEERLKTVGADSIAVTDALAGPEVFDAALDGVSHVFSCLGASVYPSLSGLYQTYKKVDAGGNLNLLAGATKAGVERFTYVSVAGAREMKGLQYAEAHEEVVDALRVSGLDYAVVRPTGFFSAFGMLFDIARKGGRVPCIGGVTAKTNPIHELDLARICADATLEAGFGERDVGGPQIRARGEIFDAMYAALDRPTKVRKIPAGLVRFGSWFLLPFAPRVAHIVRFFAHVGTNDCVGEPLGTRTLEDYFRERLAAASVRV